MRAWWDYNKNIQILLSQRENDELGALIRSLQDRLERCKVAQEIAGEPSEEIRNLRSDLPTVEKMLDLLQYL